MASAAPKVVEKTAAKLLPLFNRVLIRKAEPAKVSKAGILLPDNMKVKILNGTVVAVGPGSINENGQTIPVGVQPGDRVILPDYGGTKVALEGEEIYYLYRDTEILAKVVNNE